MRRLQMMIVDDEETIRLGFARIVGRLLPEWDVAARCGDAEAALRQAREREPDLAVIDINMPGKSGLELARELEERHPSMYKIVLTGYEKFSYAQTALRYGVADYLLKPVQRDELVQAVRKVEGLIRERELMSTVQIEKLLMEWFVSQSEDRLDALRQAFAAQGWAGRKAGAAGDGGPEYAVLVLFWDDEASRVDRLHIDLVAGYLKSAVAGVRETLGIVVSQSYTLLVVIGEALPGQEAWARALQRLGIDQRSPYRRQLRLHGVGGSHPFGALERLQEGYLQALEHLLRDRAGAFEQLAIEERERIRRLTVAIETNDGAEAVALLRQWREELVRLSRANASQAASRCFLFLSFLSGEAFGGIPSRLGATLRQEAAKLARRLPLALSPPLMLKLIEEFVDSLRPLAAEEAGNRRVIDRVQALIRQQYADPELNLESLAQAVYLHPTYLSELFKESTGQKFIDYLTSVRMEEARRMLRETDMKMYEVTEAVGYTSPKYFSSLFRKQYDMTPMDYREKSHRP